MEIVISPELEALLWGIFMGAAGGVVYFYIRKEFVIEKLKRQIRELQETLDLIKEAQKKGGKRW